MGPKYYYYYSSVPDRTWYHAYLVGNFLPMGPKCYYYSSAAAGRHGGASS